MQKAKELLEFQLKKDVSYLFNQFLILIEDIQDEHYFMLEKLEKLLPEDKKLIEAANYMDQNKFALYRKRILDAGNATIRQISPQLEKFYVNYEI